MWVEACSLVVVFVSFNYIPEYEFLKLYPRVKNDMCLFFQWRVKGSRVEKTWHISGPDCKLRLPFQIRLAYDMGSNDILEAKYELHIATDKRIFVLLLLYWSIRFLRTFEWIKSVKPRCPWFSDRMASSYFENENLVIISSKDAINMTQWRRYIFDNWNKVIS